MHESKEIMKVPRRKPSLETINKRVQSRKGYKHSAETRIKMSQFRTDHPRQIKQFYPKEHDTFVCGRTKSACNACYKVRRPPSPRKQFCIKGHLISDLGRSKHSGCRACGRESLGKRHRILNEQGVPFTMQDYKRLVEGQKGYCAFPECPNHQSKLKRALAVDYDSKTGIVRALLCNRCNSHLVASNTIITAQSLISYLLKFSKIK